jgi:hypothetical protein
MRARIDELSSGLAVERSLAREMYRMTPREFVDGAQVRDRRAIR